MRASIFWYSLRCFFSSLGSLGGSHEGRVRERYLVFSSEGWKGSIRGSLLRIGGSGTALGFDSTLVREAERESPGCCRLISSWCSISVWYSSRASVSFFASASSVVYVSSQVRCRSRAGGKLSRSLFGEGGWGKRWLDEAGEVFAVDEEAPSLRDAGRLVGGLCVSWGGLPQEEGAGDRSCTGRGEMGTFHMKASSGTSSSSSSHSASRSLAVFRTPFCQD